MLAFGDLAAAGLTPGHELARNSLRKTVCRCGAQRRAALNVPKGLTPRAARGSAGPEIKRKKDVDGIYYCGSITAVIDKV